MQITLDKKLVDNIDEFTRKSQDLASNVENSAEYAKKLIEFTLQIENFESEFGFLDKNKSLVKGLRSIVEKSYNFTQKTFKKKFNIPALKTCLASIDNKISKIEIDNNDASEKNSRDNLKYLLKEQLFKRRADKFRLRNREYDYNSLNIDEIEFLGCVSLYLKENSSQLQESFLSLMSKKIKESVKINENGYRNLVSNYVFQCCENLSQQAANECQEIASKMIFKINEKIKGKKSDNYQALEDLKGNFVADDKKSKDFSKYNSKDHKENFYSMNDDSQLTKFENYDEDIYFYPPKHNSLNKNELTRLKTNKKEENMTRIAILLKEFEEKKSNDRKLKEQSYYASNYIIKNSS